jgi:hypothetical protein
MNITLISRETFGRRIEVSTHTYLPEEYETVFGRAAREALDAGQMWSQTFEGGDTIEWVNATAAALKVLG